MHLFGLHPITNGAVFTRLRYFYTDNVAAVCDERTELAIQDEPETVVAVEVVDNVHQEHDANTIDVQDNTDTIDITSKPDTIKV